MGAPETYSTKTADVKVDEQAAPQGETAAEDTTAETTEQTGGQPAEEQPQPLA